MIRQLLRVNFLTCITIRLLPCAIANRLSAPDIHPRLLEPLLDSVATSSFPVHQPLQRSLNSPQFECGEILISLSKSDFISKVNDVLASFDGVEDNKGIKLFILSQIRSGVQVRKICSSCEYVEDVLDTSEASSKFREFCGQNAYGSNATVSGLLILPTQDDMQIATGILKGNVFAHGTIVETHGVPSDQFDSDANDTYVKIGLILTALVPSTITILPDYLGYGESSDFFKSYLVKKTYQTATIPLWLEAKKLVAKSTECKSELGDTVVVSGYSEGGYAAIAIADAMDSIGLDVVAVQAGGGPYQLSGASAMSGFESALNGNLPAEGSIYLALWGSAYSSTNTNLANYGQNQDMLSSLYRNDVLNWVNEEDLSALDLLSRIPTNGKDGILEIVNPDLVGLLKMAIENNVDEPCLDMDYISNTTDKICAALVQNDLWTTISTASYPSKLCHGALDAVASVENVPTIFARGANTEVNILEGEDHASAGALCIMDWFTYMLSQFSIVEAKSSQVTCELNPNPTSSPTRYGSTMDPSQVVGDSNNETDFSRQDDESSVEFGVSSSASSLTQMMFQLTWWMHLILLPVLMM